jgi:hypothetical protein
LLSRLATYLNGQRMDGGMSEREYRRRLFQQIINLAANAVCEVSTRRPSRHYFFSDPCGVEQTCAE